MNPFTTAFIKAPKRSRLDFNHFNQLGMRFGALTPTYQRFIVPGDEVAISMEQICRLAPMPVPTFCNLKVRHDFFFVPLRLLYGQEYLDKLFGSDTTLPRAGCKDLLTYISMFHDFFFSVVNNIPTAVVHSGGTPFVPGSLSDYLKFPVFTDRNGVLSQARLTALATSETAFANTFTGTSDHQQEIYDRLSQSKSVTIEPLFAYHFIWRDWYRFTGIQDNTIYEPFWSNGVLAAWLDPANASSPLFQNRLNCSQAIDQQISGTAPYLNGGRILFGEMANFKYAHLKKDMFTSVRYGNKPTVLIPTGSNGTIPALRQASAVQRFLDIISITGQRYFDKVKGLFGVEPVGPKDDRVQFLARYQQFIKVGEVLTTATTAQAQTGDYSGRGVLIDGRYLFKRRFTEHGWLMCISSVVPDVAYSGLERELTDVLPLDTPLPSMAEVGDQTVTHGEVFFDYISPSQNNASLGDQFRFYAYKSANNEAHGSFKMSTLRPWTSLKGDSSYYLANIIEYSKVVPRDWNYLFNDTSDEFIFGDRFFFNLDFYEKITRALPKYINYHL